MKMIENLDSNESDRTKYNEKTAKAHQNFIIQEVYNQKIDNDIERQRNILQDNNTKDTNKNDYNINLQS